VHTSWIYTSRFLTVRVTEDEKRPALYNKATPEYSDKNRKEKLWRCTIRRHQNTVTKTAKKNCEAVVSNWSRLDTRTRVAKGKKYEKNFYVHCNLFVQIFFYNLFINFDSIT
jgi:hypothetical protein